MEIGLMNLKVLLPFNIFLEKKNVKSIVADTSIGSFGILPHRLDCVAALEPGILSYETPEDGEKYIAIDEGILIKAGADVFVSVRDAIGGADLGKLREKAEDVFLHLNEQEKSIRSVLSKLESELVRRFAKIHYR
jgi:F-type H+-transporting ATPase subunit epsilon